MSECGYYLLREGGIYLVLLRMNRWQPPQFTFCWSIGLDEPSGNMWLWLKSGQVPVRAFGPHGIRKVVDDVLPYVGRVLN